MAGEVGKLLQGQKEFIRVAHDADIEVIKRTGDLLTAMDIEEGRVAVAKDPISIESLWGSVMPTLQKWCTIKQLVCQYEPSAKPLPELMADGVKIRTVMERLADNAVIYTQEHGNIHIQFEATDLGIRFTIKDTGIGIPLVEQSVYFHDLPGSQCRHYEARCFRPGFVHLKAFYRAAWGKSSLKAMKARQFVLV